MKTVIKMKNEEARDFFLKGESYFNLELPEYYNLKNIINLVLEKIGSEKDLKKFECDKPKDFETINYKMICNKDGRYGWRLFEIIHPLKYIELVNLITESNNWAIIKKRFKEFSKNKQIICCSIPGESPSKRHDKASTILSWLTSFEQKSITNSLKYNYVVETDISDCYPSIYSHSIAWAIHTRDYCKNHKTEKNLGNNIDSIIRDFSYGQTNGIPQGSALMDFIAEMVLGYADMLLSEKIKDLDDYEIIRYRDDYRIFSKEKYVVERIMKELSEVLSTLNLKLNKTKTKLSSDIISESIKEDKMFCLFNNVNETILDNKSNIENKLLVIRNVGKIYQNSGALYKLLINLYKKEMIDHKSRIKNLNQCISIVVDIMYNNPRTYNVCVAILSKFLESLESKKRLEIVDLIMKKFSDIPNTEYLNIWLQRLTIIDNEKKEYPTLICKKLYEDNKIWESDWVNFDIDESVIIDREILKNISYAIPKNIIDNFEINYE